MTTLTKMEMTMSNVQLNCLPTTELGSIVYQSDDFSVRLAVATDNMMDEHQTVLYAVYNDKTGIREGEVTFLYQAILMCKQAEDAIEDARRDNMGLRVGGIDMESIN